MTYKACYLPSSDDPPGDICGFETPDDAWDYILKHHLCSACETEYRNYLDCVEEDWENGVFASPSPACIYEWIVVLENNEETGNDI